MDLHAGERTIRARAEFREVLSILSRMKPEQAEALLLYYVDGLSVAEMAEQLRLSETAQSRWRKIPKAGVRHREHNRIVACRLRFAEEL